MTQPILPKLKKNHNVKNFKEFGKWDVRTRDALEKLGSGLKVDKVETEISSIPDMWARPMLFEMALLNPEHVLHERIRGEWRGLLAMLGLKEVVRLNRLTATPVTLPAATRRSQNGDDDPTDRQDRDFLRTLAKLLPKASLATDTSWRALYVFLFNGRPIGITSPTTLVATAADYLNRISSQEVRWYDGTHLTDPVQILTPREKQILGGWVEHLIDRLHGHRGIDNDRLNLISGLLRSFSEDLGAGPFTLSQSGFGIQGPEAGIFKYLDKPADGDIQEESHVRLIPSEGRTPARSLLVLERGIAEQWDMSPQNVTVDGGQTLASANVQVANADVWRGSDFFTKKLFVIFQESAFPGTISVGSKSLTLPGGTTNITPILPLNEGLMKHLSAEDLARCVRWDQTTEGLKVRLILRVTGPDANNPGRVVELSKLYRREDIQTLDNVPTLEIWPNFKAEGWKAYYTCYSTDDITATFAARPHSTENVTESEVSLGGRRQRRYWRTDKYPEAMVCRASIANPQTNQMEAFDAGLLLLAPPQRVAARGESYKVGIDFGASSTTISTRLGQAPPNAVKFADRKVSVTASGDRAQAQLYAFFVPRQESEMPVLSFFHDFQNNSLPDEIKPFLEGHAYLLESADQFDPDTAGLTFDLKWSTGTDDRRRVRAFLTQLCLQTAAELVVAGATEVRWAFSYPTAFSEGQKFGFPGLCALVTSECISQSGLRQSADNTEETESVAAALYFVNHRNAATAMGTVFIDIGGSTSDISIWQGNKPIWQTSVLLAGRNIFSDYLWHNPDFLGLFGVNVSQLHAAKNNNAGRKAYYALTDVQLRYKSDRIFQQLPVHAGTPQVNALRQHLALGVSGLFYYVGSLLQYLIQEGIYRQQVPNIYLCGNGSRIFRWLDIDNQRRINALYQAVFARGAGWKDYAPFQVIFSEDLKKEAAYGLAWDSDLQSGELPRKILAGESFVAEELSEDWPEFISAEGNNEKGPHTIEWNRLLTSEAFTKRLYPPEKLTRTSDFVSAFNAFANRTGLISTVSMNAGDAEEVRRRLGQTLSRYHEAKETDVVVEPVFIVALRHWLEIRLGG